MIDCKNLKSVQQPLKDEMITVLNSIRTYMPSRVSAAIRIITEQPYNQPFANKKLFLQSISDLPNILLLSLFSRKKINLALEKFSELRTKYDANANACNNGLVKSDESATSSDTGGNGTGDKDNSKGDPKPPVPNMYLYIGLGVVALVLVIFIFKSK